ncbi:MAG: molybdopterin-dependent oxidoreductase [Rhizobiales bacterium]|nr:molybdopterin-dependent oxidoreductase [Hyphomicrobiales bacterium]
MAVTHRKTIATDTVGLALAHDSAALHVSGRAVYIDDMREPDGLVHVVPGYARDAARGKIKSVDLDAVRKYPGVVAVLTCKDIPGLNDSSPTIGGDPILADGAIEFHGQVIFAVVAITRDAARRAARLAKIEIAVEKPAVTVDDAVAMKVKDILPPYEFKRHDVTAALKASVHRIGESFLIGGQEQFYLEGQIAMAYPEEGGAMTVFSSTQHPTEVQHIVAKMLGLADAQVTCECRRMGGGFGGKESQATQWGCLAALAAHVTGHPAKCRLDRDDDMMMTGKRHDFRATYEAGFDKTGRVTAVDVEFWGRCGYSADLSGAICDRTMFHADNAYFYPATSIRTRRLKTHTVSNTAFRGFGGPHLNQAGALVHVYTDGSVHLNHGGTEMGQGLYTKVAQVVAEEFGLSPDRVRITATTTAKVPNTSPTAASSGADMNGMAARAAAGTIRGRLTDFAAKTWKVAKSRIRFEKGQVIVGNQSIGFGELARKAHQARISLSSTGYYATPKVAWDRAKAKGRPFYYFAYGAACAEVTIDTLTGEMRIDRVDILHDVGRSLNPAIDIGQIEGGFVQGMGWLTTEELVYDAKGRLATHAPSTYKIPCASDVPADFRVNLYDSKGNRENTIYRSKAVGEPPLMLGIAVWSAIFNAIAGLNPGKVPPLDAPATAEAILRAVKAMRR